MLVAKKGDTSSLSLYHVLRRNKRLTRRVSFDQIKKEGEEKSSRLLISRRIKNELKLNRYGVVISKKLEKRAVKRNKLRRQIYEAIRLHEKPLAKQEGSDIVFFARRALLNQPYAVIEKAVIEHLTPPHGS